MKNKIIQFSIFIGLLFSIQANATPLKNIELSGLSTIPNSTVLSYLSFEVGDEITDYTSDQIIKTLFATGFFADIGVSINNDIVAITLIENPHIKYIDVLNYSDKVLDVDKLEKSIDDYKLTIGGLYTKKKLHDFLESLKSQYNAEGFFNLEIEQNLDLDSQNRMGIELDITEGERATIGSMGITGAHSFSEEELLDLFGIGVADNIFINYFTEKNRFTDLELNKGVAAMQAFYLNKGYLDFNIIQVDTSLSDDREKININVQISEGKQYKLGTVAFQGDLKNQKAEALVQLLGIKKGDIFNRQKVVDGIQKIANIYTDQGYAHAYVSPITQDVSNSVNLIIDISLKKKVYINRITISGNTRTQDEVIRREIGISEGGLYSRTAIVNSITKLRRIGYFSDVQITTNELPDFPDKIDLHFSVQETKTGELSFGISHSNNYGISLNAGIKEKNFLGSGNTLNAQIKFSDSYNKISFFFENPYFNTKQHSISYGAFMSSLDDNDVMTDSYKIDTVGANLGYGVPLTENTRLNSSLQYSKNDITCGSSFATSDYESSQCAITSNDEVSISINWNENTLNHYMYPTNGRSNALSVDLSLPIGDYRYIIANASHKSYRPLKNNLTLKLTGDLGIATGYSGKELPFFKRYFGGGSGSVRGFKTKTLGPEYINGRAKGGELSILASANIISPVSFIDNSDNMRMSAFVDMGNIYASTSNIDLGDLRMSVGIAFAYMSPIGAIGVYVATPLLKKSGDEIEDFALSLGTGF